MKNFLGRGLLILALLLATSGGGCKYLQSYFFGWPLPEKEEGVQKEEEPALEPTPPVAREETNAPIQDWQVEFFVVSYCPWCQKAKEWLDENGIHYEMMVLDEMGEADRQEAAQRMLQFTDRLAFPLLVVNNGEQVAQGFNPQRYAMIFKK